MHYITILFKIFMLGVLLFSEVHAIQATASSIIKSNTADKAVDGDTKNSMMKTTNDTSYEWLLIDLEAEQNLTGITLYNPSCCTSQLRNVVVMASKTAFKPNTTQAGINTAIAQSDWHANLPNDTSTLNNIPFTLPNKKYRYILIQKAGGNLNNTNTLALTEVMFTYLNYPGAQVDLQIHKSAPNTAEISKEIIYTLTVTNLKIDHAITAQKVIVQDQLPPNITYTGIIKPNGWECKLKNGGLLECQTDAMSIGETATFSIKVNTPPNTGKITNIAHVSSSTTDHYPANNTAQAITDIITSNQDLSITKIGPNTAINGATTFDYIINVNNIGKGPVKNFSVIDNLPDSLHISKTITDQTWDCSTAKKVFCQYKGTLNEGETTSNIIIRVTAPALKEGETETITNTAIVEPSDNTAKNNESTVLTTIVGGTTQDTNLSLKKYLQFNLFGDSVLIGNVNLNSNIDAPYNNMVDMQFVGFESKSGIYNKSSSTLKFPQKGKIKWAGLYWEGELFSPGPGTRYTRMPYNTKEEAMIGMHTIKLKTPHKNNFIDISANIIHKKNQRYNAFADITKL